MSTIEILAESLTVLGLDVVLVVWECGFDETRVQEFASQDTALAFVAGAPRGTAYTLIHPEPQR